MLKAVPRAGNLGTYIHLPIKLTNTIEEWDQRISFLVCRIVCGYLIVCRIQFYIGTEGSSKTFLA